MEEYNKKITKPTIISFRKSDGTIAKFKATKCIKKPLKVKFSQRELKNKRGVLIPHYLEPRSSTEEANIKGRMTVRMDNHSAERFGLSGTYLNHPCSICNKKIYLNQDTVNTNHTLYHLDCYIKKEIKTLNNKRAYWENKFKKLEATK